MEKGSRKNIYAVLVICISVVVSVYILKSGENTEKSIVKNNEPTIKSYRNIGATTDDWKKMFEAVDTTEPTINLTKNNSFSTSTFDETTLTAQMSKDFFSQYLILKKGGGEVGNEDAQKIAQNVLFQEQYFKERPRYIKENLKIVGNSKENLIKYKESINKILKDRSSQIKYDPVKILKEVIVSKNENEIKKIDSLIVVNKGFISDFLDLEIPEEAVGVHLSILNSFSNLLGDLEDMRETLNDPVRAISGITYYNSHLLEFKTVLNNMIKFLDNIKL